MIQLHYTMITNLNHPLYLLKNWGISMLDYRMETFLILCEEMNYRKTAQILHLSQPAVTHHIQHLEHEYGCSLFTYSGRQLVKTDQCRALEEYARSVKYNDLQLRRSLHSRHITQVKMGATKTIGDYVIGERVKRFLALEDYSLCLMVDNTEHLLQSLEEGQLDFAIIEGYFDKNRFGWQLLRQEPFVGICHKSHPFFGQKVSVSQLLEATIIHREEGSGTRAILEQKLKGYNESLERFHRHICISSFKLILEAVKQNLGVSFVYETLADSDEELGKFWLDDEPIIREFSIVYLKHTNLQDKIHLFLYS